MTIEKLKEITEYLIFNVWKNENVMFDNSCIEEGDVSNLIDKYLQAYELYFSLIYLNDSKYCYRIIEDNKTVIAESQRADLQKI